MISRFDERRRQQELDASNAAVSASVAKKRGEMEAADTQSDFMDNSIFAQQQANKQGIASALGGYADWADQQGEQGLPTMDDLVLQNLQASARGQDVPFSQAQQAAYMTDANTRAQAGADARIGRLQEQAMANGGNMNDPSYQAAVRQAQSQAQGNMQNQRNSIAMQAGSANYAAKQQATQGLMGLQGQLANQALANRSQQGQLKRGATDARIQSLNMPVEKPQNQAAWGNQAAKPGPQTAGNYQMPSFAQWQQSNKPQQPQADPNGWRNYKG
jgi:hypothetical protein